MHASWIVPCLWPMGFGTSVCLCLSVAHYPFFGARCKWIKPVKHLYWYCTLIRHGRAVCVCVAHIVTFPLRCRWQCIWVFFPCHPQQILSKNHTCGEWKSPNRIREGKLFSGYVCTRTIRLFMDRKVKKSTHTHTHHKCNEKLVNVQK